MSWLNQTIPCGKISAMQSYQPNTLISGRYFLKEQLSNDTSTGQQVWTVTDTQTGQALIARFHADGRTEWFNDNRPPAGNPLSAETQNTPPQPAPAVPSGVAPGKAASPAPHPDPTIQTLTGSRSPRKNAGIWITLLALSLAGAAGYLNKEILIQKYREISSSSPASDVENTAPEPETANSLFGSSQDIPVWNPEEENQSRATAAAPAPGSPENTGTGEPAQASRRLFGILARAEPSAGLSALGTSFNEAISQLQSLRNSGQHAALCDSIYAIATDRADQFYSRYRDNDQEAKANAVDWYKVSRAAKETAHNKKRLSELQRPPAGKKESSSSATDYFPKDPELNID